MRYPIAIEPGDAAQAFGVVVPDLPGCFSAGDTLDEALAAAEEAMAAWIETTLDAGEPVPCPSSLDVIRHNPDYQGWIFALVDIDPAWLDDRVERINISLPRRILKRLDTLASQAGQTRSGYISRMTLEESGHRAA
jgi:predicted RNase H-like HicB family nuclease